MQYEGHNRGVAYNPVDLQWNATFQLTVLSIFKTAVALGEVKTIAIQRAALLVRNQSEALLSTGSSYFGHHLAKTLFSVSYIILLNDGPIPNEKYREFWFMDFQ